MVSDIAIQSCFISDYQMVELSHFGIRTEHGSGIAPTHWQILVETARGYCLEHIAIVSHGTTISRLATSRQSGV